MRFRGPGTGPCQKKWVSREEMELLTPCKASAMHSREQGSGAMHRNRKLVLCLPLPSHTNPISTKLQWHLDRGTMWLQSRAILVRLKGHSKYQIRRKNQGAAQGAARCCQCGFSTYTEEERWDLLQQSDVLPWRKEQWSRQTGDTPNTPSSSYNAWKHPSACCKEMKCFNSLMWGKGLLSSRVRGFCLYKVSAVWVSKRAGVAFLVLYFSRWADALCIHNGRREGASSYEMTSCEEESGIKLRLAITSGNCSAGVWAGRWESPGKALERPKLTSQYLHSKPYCKQVQWSVNCLTRGKGLLCCQLWWLITAMVAYLCRASMQTQPGLELGQDTEVRLETPVQPMASDWGRYWSHAQTSILLPRVTSLIPHCAGYWTNRKISSLTQEPAAWGPDINRLSHSCSNDCHPHFSSSF